MSFTIILPSIWQPYTDDCLASMDPSLLARLFVYDNTVKNRGVSRAWNHGVELMRERGDDWLILLSAAVRFGPPGGLDFVAHLDVASPDAVAIEAGEQPNRPGHGFGWHLIAFAAGIFDVVGLFDENFFAYYEDNDFGQRIRCATSWLPGPDPIWPKVPVDADLLGYAHGIRLAGAYVDPHVGAAYYRTKWGGPPSCEEFTRPFGGDHPLGFWRPPYRQPGT